MYNGSYIYASELKLCEKNGQQIWHYYSFKINSNTSANLKKFIYKATNLMKHKKELGYRSYLTWVVAISFSKSIKSRYIHLEVANILILVKKKDFM